MNSEFGSLNDEVETPRYLYNWLNETHSFDFDPCPYERPLWDGLSVEWGSSNFVNPPFSEIEIWLKKGVNEMIENKKKSVFLITARTKSKYWFNYVFPYATDIILLEGGIKFKGYNKRFPVAMAVVIFDPINFKGKREVNSFYAKKEKKRAISLIHGLL